MYTASSIGSHFCSSLKCWASAARVSGVQEGSLRTVSHFHDFAFSPGLVVSSSLIAFFSRSDHTEADLVSDAAIQVMRHAAQKVAEAGLTLNIEVSEPSQRTADIVRRVDHPALGINWDPGAAYQGGEEVPFPDGFDLLRPYIRHVHFKDVTTEPTGARTVVVDGVIDWRGAFAALRADNFDGYISVETHRRPKIDSTFRMLERLRALIALPG